jgi:RNA polymerase sigma-70 factor (ECF subfamily)
MTERETHPSLFATTRWTLICEAVGEGNPGAAEALGALVVIYWKPLYRYARRRGKSKEDAEDLVQGFLAHLLKAGALRQIDRGKGRFRAFLLASFNHWMINEWKHASREKRGGGAATVSFDWQDAETGLKIEAADEMSPDRLFDREWALTLLAKVIADLEAACSAEGFGEQFTRLKSCLTADSARIAYAEVAGALDMSEGAARVAVHRLRQRYRHMLTEEVARTLSTRDAVEEEMKALFAVLGG